MGIKPYSIRFAVFALAAVAVVFGLFFRFSHLERKYYYDDEVVSSLRESGHTIADFEALFDGRVRTSEEVALLLTDRSTKPSATIASLIEEDPQHPPLFYLMNRYWTQIIGYDQANSRSLAAVFGSLAILAVFWLGASLFKDTAFAAIAAGLVALSPFEILYSQQNREYSAWLFCIALSGALLLRSLRKATWGAWIAYCGAIVFSLYTAVLFVFDIVAFAVYAMIVERMPNRVRFLVATAAALAAYLPWILVLHQGSHMVTSTGQTLQAVSPKIYLFKWMFGTGAVFFDMEFYRTSLVWILGVVLIVVVGSFIVLAKTAEWKVTLFVVTLAFVPAAIIVLSDVVDKASRGTMPRYLVPVWLGCDLAVAYLIGWLIFRQQRRPALRIAGAALLIGLFACGLVSDYSDSLAKATWTAAHMGMIGRFAAVINATRDPVVVYVHDARHWDISALGLTTVLRPDVRMQFFSSLDAAKIREPKFFLFNATDASKAEIERQLRGKWIRFDAETAGSALVRQLQAESNDDRAKRTLPADAQESPLWERLRS